MSSPRERLPLATFEDGWKCTQFLPDPSWTFPEVFAHRLTSRPDDVALTVVTGSGRQHVDRPLTYRDLRIYIENGASQLAALPVVAGDRIILSVEQPDQFFSYFMACQALGLVPVPVPPTSDFQTPTAFRNRIRSVVADCDPRGIVTGSLASWQEVADSAVTDVDVIESRPSDRSASFDLTRIDYRRRFNEIALLQYTSGSTGDPKGVIVDHYNLVANCRACTEAGDFGPHERSLSWLPTFHDMGLIGGLLFGMYLNAQVFVMTPRRFLLRPDSWLRAIQRHRITYTVAPNFAYRLVASRLPERLLEDLDLSSIRLAFDGAEPIDRDTVEAFCGRFAGCGFRPQGFYPVYGLAECTLGAAFPVADQEPIVDTVDRDLLASTGRAVAPSTASDHKVTHFVSVGRAIPGHRIRVLAREGDVEMAERRVGEIAIDGPSVTRGYWGDAGGHGATFRTGDLGYVADGRLYVVDRIKDLVIIAGRNLVPSDVERVVGNLPGVQRSSVVVFGVRGPHGTEDLAVVAAVEPRARVGVEGLHATVCRTVLEHFNVTPTHVCLVAPGGVPKTSSGKIQRAECRRLFESGELKLVSTERP